MTLEGVRVSQRGNADRSCNVMADCKKLQPKYAGYAVIKRLSSVLNRPILGRTPCSVHDPRLSVCGAIIDERRHSCGDILAVQVPGNRCNRIGLPIRSLSHGPGQWDKVVNITNEDNSLLNNLTRAQPNHNVTRKTRGHAALFERLGCGHQKLCRKKSRSQEHLPPVSYNNSTPSTPCSVTKNLDSSILINNTGLSSTQRCVSEGNIHHVPRTCIPPPSTPPPVLEWGPGGVTVGDIAKLPKRLLHRVTGEVEQLMYDIEGWKEEYLILKDAAIISRTSSGNFETLVPYSAIESVCVVTPSWSWSNKHYLRVMAGEQSFLLQVANSYARDQWLHSILWKRNAYKYSKLLNTAQRPEVRLKELKKLVDFSLTVPLHDHSLQCVPLELASTLLEDGDAWLSKSMHEEVILTLAPLLENNQPSPEICKFFSSHCSDNPRSSLIIRMFTPVATRILKNNADFGRFSHVRQFVQDYIQSLMSQNNGMEVVEQFVRDLHGPTSNCPHLRVLPNLAVVCTTAITNILKTPLQHNISVQHHDHLRHLTCYNNLLKIISEYDDWKPGLALILQPIPFPDASLTNAFFINQIVPIIEVIGTDPRCEVHQCVAGLRDEKEGWLQVLSPSSLACHDDGVVWAKMLNCLLNCCCRTKKFLNTLTKSVGACMLLSLRENNTAQQVLSLMIEWNVIENADLVMQMISTLQSTPSGKFQYQQLCDRQLHLRELQQKGGPKKLTLPRCSTDNDLTKLLSSGSFGNLESLSLAFTRVTSACADQLIKLPSLKYLNLWATQFGDNGVQQISEHLHKLQVLNLCETPVTDKGIHSLTSMSSLRRLNLNSTSLSAESFELLKITLPSLQEIDVRYTDAW